MAWVYGCKHLPERCCDCLGVLGVDRNCARKLGKYVNHGKKVPQSAVLLGDNLHIGQVDLPLNIDPRNIGVVPGIPTARRLVQRISLIAL